ncbi:hypothetical protein E2493_20610 [Sphingomonas parva]|uniref:SnoaL-like domain-containing protein n=1 Tax=Sphingomonas parva TaxID=2555898 RepID=A0A4Y8ZK39_9SPHN|nr:nuclear transport factor 2 family protein [Sphingomonas parva]TFI56370.1 hypothetical protein E2493_20610 [Sphingomonas parva]
MPHSSFSSSPALARIEQAYRRWGETLGGNLDEVLETFTEDVEIRTLLPDDGSTPVRGLYRGRDGARRYFADMFGAFDLLEHVADRLIVDADGTALVMVGRCRLRHRASGAEMGSPLIDVCELRDGGVSRLTEMFDTFAFHRATVGAPA